MASEVATPEATPRQYRERAKLIRLQAEVISNSDTRVRLLKIAEEFDALADSMVPKCCHQPRAGLSPRPEVWGTVRPGDPQRVTVSEAGQ